MSKAILLLLAATFCCCIVLVSATQLVSAIPIPNFPLQFVGYNHEIDDTDNHTLVVHQRFIWDPLNRRTRMTASGSLVHGYLEQETRCDHDGKPPCTSLPCSGKGYLVQLAGSSFQDSACMNRSIDETFSNFWSFPANASYRGKDFRPPYCSFIKCAPMHSWEFWQSNEKFFFFASQSPTTGDFFPAWQGKVGGENLYHMEFSGVRWGAPPLREYDITIPKGAHCPLAPLPPIPPPPPPGGSFQLFKHRRTF